MALADEFCLRPDKNGKYLDAYDVSMNKLSATVLFTSLGIPMLAEGQDFLRSKYGIANTFNKGDAVNALRWEERDRPLAGDAMAYYRDLIALRRSPQGAAFRVTEKPPQDYYKWLWPDETKAFGALINAPRAHAGNGFILLANSADRVASFTVSLPAGAWRIIGNGQRIDLKGLPGYEVMKGPRTLNIKVPELRALILMDGF
jgi:pullulanase